MRSIGFLAAFAAFSFTHSPAHAQCGTGDGRVLDMPGTAAIGSSLTIKMDSPPPSTMVLLMFSLGQGPIDFGSYGTLCLDFPPLLMLEFTLDANGHAELSGNVPCDPSLIGLTIYGQFISCSPGHGHLSHGSSNQEALTITGGCEIDDTIASNFNGTAIGADDYVWFNSVVKVENLKTPPATVHFKGSGVSFTANGTPYNVNFPDASILISDTATDASTVYDPVANEWQTTVPSSYTGNIFLTGIGFKVPGGLPGGINPVNWSGTFSSDTTGISFQWQWAAAVYTSFSDDPSAIGVKPIDGDKDNPYDNSDHAGTPENFKGSVTGGARGGGGSNWTGSYSGTSTVQCDRCQ